MVRWWKRRRPSRQELIDRKHQLDGEIRSLAAEVRRRRSRGEDVTGLEARLGGLRRRHYETRLEIDRTGR
jgi:hypothetical protein